MAEFYSLTLKALSTCTSHIACIDCIYLLNQWHQKGDYSKRDIFSPNQEHRSPVCHTRSPWLGSFHVIPALSRQSTELFPSASGFSFVHILLVQSLTVLFIFQSVFCVLWCLDTFKKTFQAGERLSPSELAESWSKQRPRQRASL